MHNVMYHSLVKEGPCMVYLTLVSGGGGGGGGG